MLRCCVWWCLLQAAVLEVLVVLRLLIKGRLQLPVAGSGPFVGVWAEAPCTLHCPASPSLRKMPLPCSHLSWGAQRTRERCVS